MKKVMWLIIITLALIMGFVASYNLSDGWVSGIAIMVAYIIICYLGSLIIFQTRKLKDGGNDAAQQKEE